MIRSLSQTPVKLTQYELLAASAATLVIARLNTLAEVKPVALFCEKPRYGYTQSASTEKLGPRFVRITDIKAGAIDWDSVPYCRCEDPQPYLLRSGDVLVARTGSVGKSFIVAEIREPAVFASYLIRLRPQPDVQSRYLYWCLQSGVFWDQILEMSRGSAIKNINGSMLLALKFPVPDPAMQDAVIAFLDGFATHLGGKTSTIPAAPEVLAAQRQAIAKIAELAAMAERALAYRSEATKRTKTIIASARAQVFQDLRRRAPQVYVRDVCEVIIGGTPSRKVPTYWNGTHPWASIGDLNRGVVEQTAERISDAGIANSSVKLVATGTLLMSFKLTLGKMAVAGVPLYTNEAIAALPIRDETKLDRSYLREALDATDLLVGTKDAIKGRTLNKASVGEIQLPLPPRSEQSSIVAYLRELQAQVGHLETLQSGTTGELEALLPSILDKAFKGDL